MRPPSTPILSALAYDRGEEFDPGQSPSSARAREATARAPESTGRPPAAIPAVGLPASTTTDSEGFICQRPLRPSCLPRSTTPRARPRRYLALLSRVVDVVGPALGGAIRGVICRVSSASFASLVTSPGKTPELHVFPIQPKCGLTQSRGKSGRRVVGRSDNEGFFPGEVVRADAVGSRSTRHSPDYD